MTQYLPPNLLALFAPRDPLLYMPPLDKLPHEKQLRPYTGCARFLDRFEDPKDTPPPTRVETKDERKERKRKERAEQVAYQLEQDLALWDPSNDPTIKSEAYKTLFIARINYDTSESKLRREFESYGPVKSISYVTDTKTGKPRGYGFVEYEHERDMHTAYKQADGKKIDGRRVLVDVERGRTIKGWRPRRLGGGLGGTRKGGPDVNTKFSGRDDGSFSREDRSRSRERDRRRRSRSGPRERRRRSRSPRERRRRSPREEEVIGVEEDRRRRRSRSRGPERRDRKRRRSRSPRRRSRDRRDRIKREQNPEEAVENPDGYEGMRIKQEPGGDEYERAAGVGYSHNGNDDEDEEYLKYSKQLAAKQAMEQGAPDPSKLDIIKEYGNLQES